MFRTITKKSVLEALRSAGKAVKKSELVADFRLRKPTHLSRFEKILQALLDEGSISQACDTRELTYQARRLK